MLTLYTHSFRLDYFPSLVCILLTNSLTHILVWLAASELSSTKLN